MKKTALIMLFFLALLFALKVQSVYSQTETNEVVATKKTDSSSIQLPENKTVVDDAVGHYKIPDTTKPTETFKDEDETADEKSTETTFDLPPYFFTTRGFFVALSDYFDEYHSRVTPDQYRNDQVPYFMNGDNNWMKDKKTQKEDVRIGEPIKVKIFDKWMYIWRGERTMYHPTTPILWCIRVSPQDYLPHMSLDTTKPIPTDVVLNDPTNPKKGANFRGFAIKVSKEMREALLDAWIEAKGK